MGTVQFGMDYGVSNREGKTPLDEAQAIIDQAVQANIRYIDTAHLYGSSEEVLGNCSISQHPFSVVTKTPRLSAGTIEAAEIEQVERQFLQSLSKMRLEKCYGLLVHHADNLWQKNGHLLAKKLQEIKNRGLVEKIGVTVYTSAQIDLVLENFDIDLIQLPVNVLDQRLIRNGYLDRLNRMGIEIHARSAFLQGLLLMNPAEYAPFFQPLRSQMVSYFEFIAQKGLTPLEAALGFVMGNQAVNIVICGVNNSHQLQEIVAAGKVKIDPLAFEPYAIEETKFLNPSDWRV